MDAATQNRMDARARIMKALAHPTRLFLLEQVAQNERPVAELAHMVGADISTVSKHLSLLKAVGILNDRKAGNQVFYRLACPCALDFFACLEGVMRTHAQSQIELMGEAASHGR